MTTITSDPARTPVGASCSPAKAWLRALELTEPISRNPTRIFSTVIEELAESQSEAPALLSERECVTYGALAARSNQYTRWALQQGIGRGDTVCLMMANRPEYMAIWLGITRTGCAVALLNTNLTGSSLAHNVNIVAPKHMIVGGELIEQLASSLPDLSNSVKVWAHGAGHGEFRRMEQEIEWFSAEKLHGAELRPVTIKDRALYIYTSGTTGLQKAANVSHARLMQWSHWFAGMMGTAAIDRLYNCLPMYHSSGGVLAMGAVLAAGGSVVIRENFSASQFWNDIVRWDCTLFQYIGEMCRYLLHTDANPLETQHRIRACCGNGLGPDIWDPFKTRFRIPQILEFYGATEGNVSLFNVEGKPGSIGRVPSYLAHRFPATLVQFNYEEEQPARNEQGFCIRCAPNETGEAIGRIVENSSNAGDRFEGYSSEEASAKKIIRDVLQPGDAWFRTGDLMRRDEQGYFYFVDRIGDTFRWKGENVATSEVAAVICGFPGVTEAIVYGVSIPGADGRAGMAVLVTSEELDLADFRIHLLQRLPRYAQPLFLRIRAATELTSTFKYIKDRLVLDGCDPAATSDVIYFNHPERGAFIHLNTGLFEEIKAGQIKL